MSLTPNIAIHCRRIYGADNKLKQAGFSPTIKLIVSRTNNNDIFDCYK
jgi:hypothetical protein